MTRNSSHMGVASSPTQVEPEIDPAVAEELGIDVGVTETMTPTS